MPEAHLLTPEPYETVKVLLPRGINIVGQSQYGGAVRYVIAGKELAEGKGYSLVSTDGPLMRCIELVEDGFESDPLNAGTQPQRPPA